MLARYRGPRALPLLVQMRSEAGEKPKAFLILRRKIRMHPNALQFTLRRKLRGWSGPSQSDRIRPPNFSLCYRWTDAVCSPGFSLFAGVWEIPEISTRFPTPSKARNFLFARSRAVTRTLNYKIYP